MEPGELSQYQQELIKRSRKNQAKSPKLFPHLGEQREVMHHIEPLQLMVAMGVEPTTIRLRSACPSN